MAASGVSIDALLVTKKRVTEKIVDCLKEFLQEGEPEIFNRDAYDALEDTYSTPELKESFAKAIDTLQTYLCDTFGLGPAKVALLVCWCDLTG
jgi:hypothetical protein